MTRKLFDRHTSADVDETRRRWRTKSTVKCAHINCGLQSCIVDVPLRTADALLLDRSTQVRHFERGQQIFVEGDAPAGLYCVRSGVALLTYKDAFRADKAVRLVGSGDIIGYRSLFAEEPHGTSAEALTPCHVCFFPKAIIVRLADAYPLFSRLLFRKLAREMGTQTGAFIREHHLPVRLRFIHFLRVMQQRYGIDDARGGICVHLPIMRRQIASVLSARPESVARAIAELERGGLAEFHGRDVFIPEPRALYDIVDGAANEGSTGKHP